jgi:mRNA deadenylase 3'-5' endonuclease subunit Ccr4
MEVFLTFSTVTWNILADAYIKPGRYDHVPPSALLPGPRRALLLRQLLQFDADLYCLQEVEPDAFAAIGEALGAGYEGLYEQKHNKPDGCAIFFRKGTFSLLEREGLHFRHIEPGYDHVALIALLVHDSGHRLALVSTHLRWQPESTAKEIHLGRNQLLEILERRAALRPKWPTWLVCGDFNALSDGVVLQAAKEQGLELSCRALRPWDTTNIGGRMRKLDYLLYGQGELVPSPRPLPRLQRDTPMPSSEHASDHLPLCVDYQFLKGA